MKVKIIQIGNSKGLRLSKTILKKYEIRDTVELILEEDHIIIKPANMPRQGWKPAFEVMHENGDDNLFINDFLE